MPGGVSWFPGHMVRARRQVAGVVHLVDVIIEVRDARAPLASANPDLEAIAGRRPRLVALARSDLADPLLTRAWAAYLTDTGLAAVPVDAARGRGVAEVRAGVRRLFAPALEGMRARGRLARPPRVMIVGMPNVGKSSLLNRLAGGRRARVGELPGVTRGLQWVRVGKDFELLDVPGILVPRFLDPGTGYLLAALGVVRDEVVDLREVALFILPRVLERAPAALVEERLGLRRGVVVSEESLGTVARARGCLLPGGEPDPDRAAALVLRDLREGRLGRLTFERPPEAGTGRRGPARGAQGPSRPREGASGVFQGGEDFGK